MPPKQIKCSHSGHAFTYEIVHGLNPAVMAQVDADWAIEKNMIVQQLLAEHPSARANLDEFFKLLPDYNLEDWHWKWSNKALACAGPEYEWFHLIADNKVQAVAIIYHPKGSKLKNDNIFYVDYLATAYWNRKRPNYSRQFSGVGSLLLAFCVDFAVRKLKYRPGFSLHSLPKAEPYYARIGMTDLGVDPGKENLRCFEASEEVAVALSEATTHG